MDLGHFSFQSKNILYLLRQIYVSRCYIIVKNIKDGDPTETVLYADVLFLVDFSMDTVAIWLSSKLLHSPLKSIRCAVAASIGALSSTVLTVLMADRIISIIIGIITSLVMCFVVFGYGGLFVFVKRCAVLWTVGMILGGIMTFLLSHGNYSRVYTGDELNSKTNVHLFPVAAGICSLFMYFLRRVNRKRNVMVSIIMNSQTIDTVGLVDSGNLLKDPISGDGVIVVSKSLLPDTYLGIDVTDLKSLTEHGFADRMRLIPVSGVTGSKVLVAFRPEKVRLDGRTVKCLVAVSDEQGSDNKCIVPESIT